MRKVAEQSRYYHIGNRDISMKQQLEYHLGYYRNGYNTSRLNLSVSKGYDDKIQSVGGNCNSNQPMTLLSSFDTKLHTECISSSPEAPQLSPFVTVCPHLSNLSNSDNFSSLRTVLYLSHISGRSLTIIQCFHCLTSSAP